MAKKPMLVMVPMERIERANLSMRGQRVMLDRDLAELYRVQAIALRQQVKRNRDRFPEDFMFQLAKDEADALVAQNVIPSLRSLGGSLPYVFTQEGVALLSSVLRSRRAVEVNIAILRAFVRLRELLASNKELARKLDELEKRYDQQFKVVFDAIRQLMAPEPPEPPRRFGLRAPSSNEPCCASCETVPDFPPLSSDPCPQTSDLSDSCPLPPDS